MLKGKGKTVVIAKRTMSVIQARNETGLDHNSRR